MKALLVAALVAAGANSMHVSQLAGGGGAVTGTGEILTDALYCEAPASDIDALACALRGASAYPQGTHAAGILYLGGGEGVTKIAITAANCAGNYVDIGCNGLTATRFHYGAGLDFEGATDTLAAASLATNATTLTDVLATDVTGTVYLLPDATCVSIELATDDATCAAITDGSNAGVVVRGPFTATGGVHFDDDVLATFGNTAAAPDCQFEWDHLGATPDEFSLTCGGNQVFSIETGSYDLKLGGDLVMHQLLPADVLNPDSILHASPIFDVATDDFSISSQGPFEGVNAAQTAGGDICAVPKTGAVNFTGVTQAGTALDTIVFSGVKEDCSTYSVTLTEGADYVCAAAASDAECVCNLKAAIDAHATLGPLTTTYRTDETCSDEKLAVFANPALTLVVTPSDTVNTVRVAGTAGSMVVPAPLTVTGAASFDDDIKMTGGDDIVNSVALTGDSASNTAAMLKLGTDASPFATTAARKIGGATVIAGGIGTANATLTVGNCALAAIVIAGTDQAGASWTQTFTEGTDWARGGTDTSAALALANAIDVGATTSLYVTASNVAGVVGIEPIPGKVSTITFTGDGAGTCAAEVNGADGNTTASGFIFRPLELMSVSVPGLSNTGDSTSGINIGRAAGFIEFIISGTRRSYINGNGQFITVSDVLTATDLCVGDDVNPYVSAAATDVAVPIMTITTEEPYAATPPQTTPTNTTGGNIVLTPANGSRRLADSGDNDGMCGGAECAAATGTTVITWPTQTDGVVTNCVLTEGAATAAGVFHCNGHTEAECATSVCAAMTVAPCTLLTCTAANNVVSVKRVAGSVSYIGPGVVTAGGGTNIVAENGTDGHVVTTTGTTALAAISPPGDPDTGFSFSAANTVDVLAGAARAYFTATALTLPGLVSSVGMITTSLEADLAAGACTAGTWKVDTGGAARELCRCNDAGTNYDCISVTTAAGPTD
jgi:hypothetical protein